MNREKKESLMKDYLKQMKEECPEWLKNYRKGDKVNMQEVLNCRTLYYPGSGSDGQPIKTFNEAKCVHVFVYVDYMLGRDRINFELQAHAIKGYNLYDTVEISEKELTPDGWAPHIEPDRQLTRFGFHEKPFYIMDIFERAEGYSEEHGAERFAVFFLYADAHTMYDALYASQNIRPPFALVLQDHGFGCNYDHFGNGGLMHRFAKSANALPELLLVADNTECWDGYEKAVPDFEIGGMHCNKRYIYIKERRENDVQ